MIEHKQTNELLKRALSYSSADETEVVMWGLEEQLTRFANNVIHQHVAEANCYVIVRAVLGKRIGVGATNDLTDAGLEQVVETACSAAKLCPEDRNFPGLPEPATVPEIAAFDEATAGCSPADRAKAVRVICQQAKAQGCIASGAFRTGTHEIAVANSHGLFAYHPVTEADFTTVVMADSEGSGYAADASWKISDIDVTTRGEEAIAKALRSRNPQPIEPGDYPVVLESYAVNDLASTISMTAGASFMQEGRSWLTGRQGKRLMSPLVSVWDDGRDPAGWPLPFDFEGVARQRVNIVRQGVAGDALYDRERAIKDGQTTTGHTLPATNPYSPWLNAARYGPISLHSFMAPGDSPLEEMIAGTERGIYVSRFWYTRTVHPREMVVTGMTRDGTFLIERGELTMPVNKLRFTQSYVEALAGTEAVGGEVRREWADPGVCSAPALKLAAFRFTG
ncbi:MAG: TldD/PmbA family protein [Anaerolineae bacterium]